MPETKIFKESVDLNNCDREKIHQIPFVQGHGVFFSVNATDLRIKHVSENVISFFSLDNKVNDLIGKKLNDVIDSNLSLHIQSRIKSFDPVRGEPLRFEVKSNDHYDIFIFKMGESSFGIEIEKLDSEVTSILQPDDAINAFVQRLHSLDSLEAAANEASRTIRLLTGMDRVLIYRFIPPTMYGEVIGEDKVAHTQTFMRHRFPATDIPKPARDLYLRNHVRYISDSHSENSNIFPMLDPIKNTPVDMSDSRLRGVSPIHTEYMKNMGVISAVSVAIIVDKKLWGLVSCHHSRPKSISHATRSLCQIVSNTFALSAPLLERTKIQERELSFYNTLHELFVKLNNSEKPLDTLFREGSGVLSLFDCEGLALVSKQKVDILGVIPLPLDLRRIWSWAMTKMDKEGKLLIYTDSLAGINSEFEDMKYQASGIIVIRLSELSDSLLILTRPEYLETIYWGGDPRKNIENREYGGKINPRASFDSWEEVIKNTSKPWKEYELDGARFFKNLVFDSLVNREQLIQELNEKLSMRKS